MEGETPESQQLEESKQSGEFNTKTSKCPKDPQPQILFQRHVGNFNKSQQKVIQLNSSKKQLKQRKAKLLNSETQAEKTII